MNKSKDFDIPNPITDSVWKNIYSEYNFGYNHLFVKLKDENQLLCIKNSLNKRISSNKKHAIKYPSVHHKYDHLDRNYQRDILFLCRLWLQFVEETNEIARDFYQKWNQIGGFQYYPSDEIRSGYAWNNPKMDLYFDYNSTNLSLKGCEVIGKPYFNKAIKWFNYFKDSQKEYYQLEVSTLRTFITDPHPEFKSIIKNYVESPYASILQYKFTDLQTRKEYMFTLPDIYPENTTLSINSYIRLSIPNTIILDDEDKSVNPYIYTYPRLKELLKIIPLDYFHKIDEYGVTLKKCDNRIINIKNFKFDDLEEIINLIKPDIFIIEAKNISNNISNYISNKDVMLLYDVMYGIKSNISEKVVIERLNIAVFDKKNEITILDDILISILKTILTKNIYIIKYPLRTNDHDIKLTYTASKFPDIHINLS
jgi:hypothetical protein